MREPTVCDIRKLGRDELYAMAPEGYYFMDMYGHKYLDIMVIRDEDEKNENEDKLSES